MTHDNLMAQRSKIKSFNNDCLGCAESLLRRCRSWWLIKVNQN